MDQVRPRTSGRRARVAALLATAGAATLLTAPPAAAADVAPGIQVNRLPFSGGFTMTDVRTAGKGSRAANDAVAKRCNGGAPLPGAQWYQLPHADTGPIRFQTRGIVSARGAREEPSGSAVVRTRTGAVVSCGDGLVTPTAAGEQLSVVSWYRNAGVAECGEDYLCSYYSLETTLVPSSGAAPANDALGNARTITSLPFEDTADTTLATADGPKVFDYANCELSAITPAERRSVWWRYTPPATVELRPEATSSDGARLHAGVLEVTPSGPVRAKRRDEDTDPGDCDSPVVAQAGKTYLLGVVLPYDEHEVPGLFTGATVDLRIGAVATPGQPSDVRTTVNGPARSAGIHWRPPSLPGTSPITGYRVSRDGTDSGGTGPWSTTLPATARSFSFHFLNPWDAYRLTVQPLSAAGAGTPVTRVVATQGPAPSRVLGLAAARGARAITLSWQPPAHAGSAPIVGYRVRRFDGTGWSWRSTHDLPATARSFTATGLDGKPYSFEVVAVNRFGPGRWTRSPATSTRATP